MEKIVAQILRVNQLKGIHATLASHFRQSKYLLCDFKFPLRSKTVIDQVIFNPLIIA